MNKINELLGNSHYKLVESVLSDDIDHLLLYIAVASMKFSGHRYGSFLDAATTAAKLAIYTTYLEQDRKLRRTGLIHHVETKRVKAIVREVESAIIDGDELKSFGSKEPRYLIGFPHMWIKKYPYVSGPRFKNYEITRRELTYLENMLPQATPSALVLSNHQFMEVLEEMHSCYISEKVNNQASVLSDAMAEHMKYCLLSSGTVLRVKLEQTNESVFLLAKTTYSPNQYSSRVGEVIRDTLDFFKSMRLWAQKSRNVFRALEMLQIRPEDQEEAYKELDVFLLDWANKYHSENGESRILNLTVGPKY
ncbi:heterocyst differentiation control protein [Halomicronema sp. CCY15110]|uniref:heterocyst differentiation control protein n=1 Tax=Halomicronema sp. CCY15110 TaxID=2767773 RepID=UPI00194FE9D9|nr:heterocyst differentiation control protein [Halomicronema sp. CCY15110]